MFDFVLCAWPLPPEPSAEFVEGVARLRHQLGPRVQWLPAADPTGNSTQAARPLREQILQLLALAGAGRDDATVLVLAHHAVLLADASLQWLHEAATAVGDGVALCWSSSHPPPGHGPDYATARGLERYAWSMREALQLQPASLPKEPGLPDGALVAGARVGTMRRWLEAGPPPASWTPGCFAHDFGNYHHGHEARRDMLPWVPNHARRILDVGGGAGRFLALLRAERGCETHLSEWARGACELAAGHVDHIWQGDFMDFAAPALPAGGEGAFDCITFLDSLEHAAEPGLWLQKARTLLQPEGCIVGSVPNVGHWSVVADLLEGRWDYCPVGIHCNTHLRFFTRRTLCDLLERHGFQVETMEAAAVPAPAHWRSLWLATPGLATQGAELDAYAFHFRATMASGRHDSHTHG